MATYAILRWLLCRPQTALPLDYPCARSLHTQPTPRIGGVAICAAALPPLAFTWAPSIAAIAAALAILSFAEDRYGVPAVIRFVAHLTAGALVMSTFQHILPWLPLVIGTVAIAWMTNLYNFMDGADGMAGSMTLVGFGAYAAAAMAHGNAELALANAVIAACAAGFLPFNLHPARTFLGDAGSIPLGFLAAAIGLSGWNVDTWPWWFPLVVFSPFIVDATLTLARRILAGEKFWQPHCSHYYQRLVRIGWGHRKTISAEFLLMVFCAILALAGLRLPVGAQYALLTGVLVLYAALATCVDRFWAHRVPADETAENH